MSENLTEAIDRVRTALNDAYDAIDQKRPEASDRNVESLASEIISIPAGQDIEWDYDEVIPTLTGPGYLDIGIHDSNGHQFDLTSFEFGEEYTASQFDGALKIKYEFIPQNMLPDGE